MLMEAYTNRDALEEKIAEGRRNRKEAGNKYGEQHIQTDNDYNAHGARRILACRSSDRLCYVPYMQATFNAIKQGNNSEIQQSKIKKPTIANYLAPAENSNRGINEANWSRRQINILVTDLVPSEMACLASSPGRMSLTLV